MSTDANGASVRSCVRVSEWERDLIGCRRRNGWECAEKARRRCHRAVVWKKRSCSSQHYPHLSNPLDCVFGCDLRLVLRKITIPGKDSDRAAFTSCSTWTMESKQCYIDSWVAWRKTTPSIFIPIPLFGNSSKPKIKPTIDIYKTQLGPKIISITALWKSLNNFAMSSIRASSQKLIWAVRFIPSNAPVRFP